MSTKPLSPLDVLGGEGEGEGGEDELLSVDHDPLNEGAVGKIEGFQKKLISGTPPSPLNIALLLLSPTSHC